MCVSPNEELNTSSVKVHSPRGSSLTTAGWHVQTAISLEALTMSMPTSGCARVELRSSVRAGFDAASTMLHRSLNGDARLKSSFSSKLRLCRPRHSNGVNLFLIGDPCHSSTPCPIAVGPRRGHTRGSGACPRPGADSRGATQRENEGHPIFLREERATSDFGVLSHPLAHPTGVWGPRGAAPGIDHYGRSQRDTTKSVTEGYDGSRCAWTPCSRLALRVDA